MRTTFPLSHTRNKINSGCPSCYEDENHILRCTKHKGKRCDPSEIPFELCNFYNTNTRTVQSELNEEELVEKLVFGSEK